MNQIEKPSGRFPKTFWSANSMELFERWAYYGVFSVFAIYLTDPVSEHGMGFSHAQKGMIMGVGTLLLYLLPIISGAFADRFGYKKMLLISYFVLTAGYFLLSIASSYSAMFATFIVVAIGAAIFKPIIVSTVAKVTNEENSTKGFGIFYMIVNIGAFIGPYVSSRLRANNWDYVFYVSSAIIAFNFLLLFLFYKEPVNARKNPEKISKTLAKIGLNMLKVIIDYRFMLFLLLMSGFWAMYMQLFFSLPVYIKEWVDTTPIYNSSHFVAKYFGKIENNVGIIPPELMENMVAFFVILFQFLISSLIAKTKPINTIIVGTGLTALGVFFMGMSHSAWFMIVAIMIFAFGEMSASPRSQEYISKIAPSDKTALYLGYSFLSIALGNFFAGLLSGSLYGTYADKSKLIRFDLVQKGLISAKDAALLERNELMNTATTKLGLSAEQLTLSLKETYHPEFIWTVFALIGLGTMVLLWLYNLMILKRK